MRVKILSDRTSSLLVFFERTYFFVTKHLPIRSSFLKLFCSNNELLDSKLRRFTNICSIKKKFHYVVVKHILIPSSFFPNFKLSKKTLKNVFKLERLTDFGGSPFGKQIPPPPPWSRADALITVETTFSMTEDRFQRSQARKLPLRIHNGWYNMTT